MTFRLGSVELLGNLSRSDASGFRFGAALINYYSRLLEATIVKQYSLSIRVLIVGLLAATVLTIA